MIRWHHLPERPRTPQDIILRLNSHDFCVKGYYAGPVFMLLYYDDTEHHWDDRYVRDDDIECWCGVEEVAAFLDGKEI